MPSVHTVEPEEPEDPYPNIYVDSWVTFFTNLVFPAAKATAVAAGIEFLAAKAEVVAKYLADQAWKLRYWGLACVLLTLWVPYFVLLPLLAAHPTFSIVLSVVAYVRTHPRKQPQAPKHHTYCYPATHPHPLEAPSQRHLTSRNRLRAGLLVLLAHRPGRANQGPEAGCVSVRRLHHLLAVVCVFRVYSGVLCSLGCLFRGVVLRGVV